MQDEQRSLSMSCSDKILIWNAMGIQGSFLIQFLQEKIFISSFVIEVSSATQENMQTVRRGLIPFERMNFCNLESQQDQDKDKDKEKTN